MPEISNLISNSIPEFNPFEGPEISDIIPTTESQLEIWLSCKLGGKDANRAFNESLSLRFEGDFDRMAFEKALNSLIVRHQSLRSAFTKDGSQMVVFKDLPLNYSFEDLSMSSLSQVQKENLIKRYAKNEVLHTFDLLYGPLFKFSLIKFSEKEHFFTLTAHHIICDGWSIGLLIQDLGKFYSSFVQNMTPVLPEADQFTSYAREQQKYITSNEYIRNENFWLDQFKNNIPVLNLPTDFPRPTPRTYKSSRIDFKLDPTLAESLKKIGIKEGCSFVNTLLAAFELFLHSITGQEDIIIGLPAAGQLVSGKYGLVGHCVNLLPIRSYPNPQLNFSEYLKVRKLAILDSYEHQKLTFSTLLKKLKTPRNASRIPLVPVVFNIDMEIENDTYFHGLKFDIFSNPREYENFELFLNLWSAKSSIQLEWSYNTQLFQKETVEKMMKDFETLLQNIVSNPLQKIENLVHLSGAGNADRQHQTSADVHSSAWYKNKFYWLRQLDGDLNIPRFPADNLVTSGMVYEGQLFHRVLNREDIDALRKTVSENKGDLFTGLTAVLNILVARYTGLNDIILGGQTDTLALGQSGQLSMLPLRCRLKEGDSFNRVYSALNHFLEDASSHLEYALDDLLKELNYSETGDGNQLFSIRSVFQHFDPVIQPGINDADISFVFRESGDDISLFIQYNSNLYNEASIQRMAGHFENILHVVLMDPNMGFRDIDYLNSREKEEILKKFNHTAIGYPDKDSVVSLFEKQVLKTPENTALVFDNTVYSYERLNELSNQFANYLNTVYNLQPEDLVGVKLERSEWMIVAVLGVLKSGAAYVPVDKDYPEERISYILNDCSCKVLIDEQELKTFLGKRDTLSSNNPDRRIRPDDLAYIMYTSGSTGQPKGVMVEHRNIVRLVCSPNYIDLIGSETLLSTGAFSFDATTFEYWSMLLNGGKLVICSQKSLLDIRLLAEEIQKHEVNVMWFTAGWLNQLVDADITIFKGLKYLLAGGDRLSAAHINLLLQTYPSLHIINGYGPTENTTFSLTYPVNEKMQNIPVGKPIGNSTAYIFDAHMKLVPVGVEGEIYLGGAGLSRGYLNNPKLTSEKFILNPYNPFERLYRSGDIGRWLPDGNISFSGRRDHQVKIRGYRIEPGEIESAVQTYPGVEKCLVLVKEEKSREKNLVAYIASKKGVNSADLRSFLSRKIPVYMVPAHFVVMKEFPLNANGKIDRQRLPDPENASNENSRDDYQTNEEKVISEIWRDLLGIKTISRTDNFFEIGGHSLIAIQFIIRLENELNVKLPMSSLFEYPTVEKISKLISSDNKMQKWKTLIPIKPTGSKVPLYLVHGGGLGVLIFNNIVIYLDKDQPVYGLQALGIDGLDEPLETIEEMASFYISEILEQNPDGPYHIAGLSAGGLIAFDMAQQLKAMGKEVKMVGVFDFNLIDTEEAGTFSQKLMNTISNLFPIILFNVKAIFKYPVRTMKYYIMCWKLRYITMMKRLGYEQEEQLDGLHMHLLNAISKNNDAIKKYKLKPYDGEIDLFISKEKVYFQEDPDYMGWKPFAKKGIHVHEVNGDHDDMILQPNNKFFAEVLQRVLDKRS